MIERVKTQVERLYPEILETLEQMTKIDRGSRFVKGLTQMADYLEAKLRYAGCKIERYEDEIYGPTLVGRKRGNGHATIFLYAHMDTVWPEGTCAQRPFRIQDNMAFGPGVSDCSHGIIASLYALKALNALGIENYKELILLFNPDEELYSPCSEKYIAQYAKIADVAFCMEGSDVLDEYISHRGGVIFYEIEVQGVKSHAGGMPEKGRNAIEELAHKITLIHSLKIKDAFPQTTLLKGGISEGMIPDHAWAHVDIRVDSLDAIEEIKEAMRKIEADTLIEGTHTTCMLRPGGCLPMVRTEEADKFCKLMDEVSAEADYPLHEAFCGGGANAVISQLAGTPTLDGLAPTSYRWHTDDECLDLSAVVPRVTILAETIRRIGEDDKYLKR